MVSFLQLRDSLRVQELVSRLRFRIGQDWGGVSWVCQSVLCPHKVRNTSGQFDFISDQKAETLGQFWTMVPAGTIRTI